MAALFQGKPLRELKVADSMSRDIRASSVDDRPEDVELLMREQRIRRVPVMDASGALVGIVSLADLALAARTAGNMAEGEVGHTLAAICQRGAPRVEAPP
jgi:CBS-domain-containing membrane protein